MSENGPIDYDVIVVGLGGAGSSAAYHLAAGGARVLGLEQFGPVHALGSSHGGTRIYRTAYFEGTQYVPLVQRAQELWLQLEHRTGEPIIRRTGGLVLGRRDSPTVAGSLRSATRAHLRHELLDSDTVASRFPQFRPGPEEVGVFDPDAGVLFPENCIRAHAAAAVEAGAELHYGEAVRDWVGTPRSVAVRTARGVHRAGALVVTSGAWTSGLVPDLSLPLEIERQFMLWFPATDPALVGPSRMPVFVWDQGTTAQTYGVPDFGDGVKVGSWHGKVAARPDLVDRAFVEAEAQPVRTFVSTSLRGLAGQEVRRVSCLYTNTPDRHFVIGRHPVRENVIVVSACSGHGFKFTSVVGEIVASLVAGRPTGFRLEAFDPGRFGIGAGGR